MTDFSFKATVSELQRNGKYSIAIDVIRNPVEGVPYRHSTMTSPGFFTTTEEAFAAGARAIAAVEATGMFPNMCEPF